MYIFILLLILHTIQQVSNSYIAIVFNTKIDNGQFITTKCYLGYKQLLTYKLFSSKYCMDGYWLIRIVARLKRVKYNILLVGTVSRFQILN